MNKLLPTLINPEGAIRSRVLQAEREARKANKKRLKRERDQARFEAALRNPESNTKVNRYGFQSKKQIQKQETRQDLLDKIKEQEALIKSLLASKIGKSFYDTDAWRKLRYEALKRSNGQCELCGNGRLEGAILQVDHIKPRSKFPELELDPANLQVLCKPCNLGKSNRDSTDWRKPALKVVGGS